MSHEIIRIIDRLEFNSKDGGAIEFCHFKRGIFFERSSSPWVSFSRYAWHEN
jgi:hypothetical protein